MVLKSVTDNLPPTPGRQVRYLKAELEKTDAENEALRNQVGDLTKALESMTVATASATATAPTAEDKKTGKKDKNAPKPAVTAYKYWCEDAKVAPENADKSGKEMQEMWKAIVGDARQKYVDMATEDKKRFERENAEYEALQKLYDKREQDAAMELLAAHKIAALAVGDKDSKKKKKKKKDPEAPKRAMSAYMFFCGEKREEITKSNPNKTPVEITKILGEEWNKLEKGKSGRKGTKKFETMAEKDRLRYEKEKAAYDAIKAEEQHKAEEEREEQLQRDREQARKMVEEEQMESEALRRHLEAEAAKKATSSTIASSKGKKKVDKPKGPKKPSTSYNCFVAENREKIKAGMKEGATFAEVSAEVGRQWGMLSDKQKTPYVTMAEQDKARYQREMDAVVE